MRPFLCKDVTMLTDDLWYPIKKKNNYKVLFNITDANYFRSIGN